jgi:NAD(P)-dependent dehydrogenase (short-subunit alcohol dehydrogenase family)
LGRGLSAVAPLRTRFDQTATAADVLAGVDLGGRRAIVTGANSGIGLETAAALAGAGAEVTLAVRDVGAGERAAEAIAARGGRRPRVARLDLAEPGTVGALARAWEGPLHVLVCNAGVTFPDLRHDRFGNELQFAVNHLGHFLLALGLRRALIAGAPARVVAVSSSSHLRSPVVFDDLAFGFRAYDRSLGYGQSKTANVLFAVGLTERWGGDGVLANALNPGVVATGIERHLGADHLAAVAARGDAPDLASAAQGAATSALLAGSPLLEGVGGHYFEACQEAERVERRERSAGVAPYALDPGNAARLWEVSRALLAPTGELPAE